MATNLDTLRLKTTCLCEDKLQYLIKVLCVLQARGIAAVFTVFFFT